jgi:hypothetical protein
MKCFRYLYFTWIIILLSCSRDVIGEHDMVVIIAELHKADRYVNVNYQLLREADTTRVYEAVLNKYDYSTADFVRSLDYYLERPGKLKSIYLRAKSQIDQEDELVEQLIELEKREESFLKPLREILNKSERIIDYDNRKRSWRWLMLPDSFPVWNVTMGDSLWSLYENPGIIKWWTNNFRKDKSINYLTLEDEKDSSPVYIPPKRDFTDKKRGIDDR